VEGDPCHVLRGGCMFPCVKDCFESTSIVAHVGIHSGVGFWAFWMIFGAKGGTELTCG